MDGYIIRKGEPVDWFTYEDGRIVDCEAGVDLWVTRGQAGNRHVQPLSPLGRGECLIKMKPTEGYDGAVSGNVTVLSSKSAFDFDPFTYTNTPFKTDGLGDFHHRVFWRLHDKTLAAGFSKEVAFAAAVKGAVDPR